MNPSRLSNIYLCVLKMAYRRKTKRTKRPRKQAPGRNLAFKSNVSTGRGFPKKMTMTHKFFYNGTIANSTGTPSTIASEQFSVNGMYQPVISGTTHQPLYYDQMSAIYHKYTVIGSKIKVTLVNNGSTNAGAIACMYLNEGTSAPVPTLMTTMVEMTGGKHKVIHAGGSGGGSNSTNSFTYTWSAKKRFGGSVLANDILSAASTASPAFQNTYLLAMQDLAATTSESLDYTVEITYIAVWQNLKDLTGS